MVLVRLVECSALVLLLSAAHELWAAWDNAGFDGFLGRSGPLVLDRVWSVVHNQSRGPVAAALAALLLAGCLWALHRLGPVASASALRVEVGLLAAGGLVLELASVGVVAGAWAVPYGPEHGPSPLAVGEDRLTALLPVAAWPVATLLLYVVLGGVPRNRSRSRKRSRPGKRRRTGRRRRAPRSARSWVRRCRTVRRATATRTTSGDADERPADRVGGNGLP
jgi:hypothetical protein